MKRRFVVFAYGDEHASLYESIAVRSASHRRNRPAFEDAVISVYSDNATMERIARASRTLAQVETHLVDTTPGHYAAQVKVFLDEMGRCVRDDAAMILLNPDCFWGDGSLTNMIRIAGEQPVCIAVPHPRVDAKKFQDEWDYRLVNWGRDIEPDNSGLVSMAMQTLHSSWKDADTAKGEANSFLTGIGMREISRGIYAVHHLLPTVFYARPSARDYGFFKQNAGIPGLWDHHWPQVLVEDSRLRVVGSSDAVFLVELTNADTHGTEKQKIDPVKPDAYNRTAPHIETNRMFVSVWREQGC